MCNLEDDQILESKCFLFYKTIRIKSRRVNEHSEWASGVETLLSSGAKWTITSVVTSSLSLQTPYSVVTFRLIRNRRWWMRCARDKNFLPGPRALWFSWSSSCPISPHLLQPDRNPPSGWPAHLRAGFRWIRWRRARALRPVRSRRADSGWWTSSARLMELLRRVGMETRWEVRPVSTRLLVVSVISQTLTAARITCGPSVTTPSTRYRTSTSTGRQKRRWERNSSDRHSLNYTMSPTRCVRALKHHLTAYLTLLFLKFLCTFKRHKNVK